MWDKLTDLIKTERPVTVTEFRSIMAAQINGVEVVREYWRDDLIRK